MHMPHSVKPKYRLVPVPEALNATRVVVTHNPKAKGAKGAFNYREEKRKGKYYDLISTNGSKDVIRISEEERIRLGLSQEAGMVDMETGQDMSEIGELG